MQKKSILIILLVALLSVSIFTGCSKDGGDEGSFKQEEPKGSINSDIAQEAEAILELTYSEEWDKLYEHIHPDIKATVSKEEFIKQRKEAQNRMKIEYKGFRLVDAVKGQQWKSPDETLTFEDVAQVSYRVEVETPRGTKDFNNFLNLAKDSEGKWRYLWSAAPF